MSSFVAGKSCAPTVFISHRLVPFRAVSHRLADQMQTSTTYWRDLLASQFAPYRLSTSLCVSARPVGLISGRDLGKPGTVRWSSNASSIGLLSTSETLRDGHADKEYRICGSRLFREFGLQMLRESPNSSAECLVRCRCDPPRFACT